MIFILFFLLFLFNFIIFLHLFIVKVSIVLLVLSIIDFQYHTLCIYSGYKHKHILYRRLSYNVNWFRNIYLDLFCSWVYHTSSLVQSDTYTRTFLCLKNMQCCVPAVVLRIYRTLCKQMLLHKYIYMFFNKKIWNDCLSDNSASETK